MKFSTLFLVLIIMGISFNSIAQRASRIPSETPKLVVGIVVDHMRGDYLYRYSNLLSDGGFKRLMNQGSFCKNARYSYLFSQSGIDHATIYTGTMPSYHGIIANAWYDRNSEQTSLAKADKRTKIIGSRTKEKGVSPRKLLAPTLGDELKLFNKHSKVIGVGLNAETALFSAGHGADGAYWIDEQTGDFVSSSYYSDTIRNWVRQFNDKKFADFYLNRSWTPYDGAKIRSASSKLMGRLGLSEGFFHDLKLEKNKIGYKALKESPFANMLVKDFAISTIINENLGKDDDTDILSISFSCLDEKHRDFSPFAPEMIDNFIRLDKEIEHLLEFLDDQIGMQNVLVFLTSAQTSNYTVDNLQSANIPSGEFSSYNSIALLRSYFNIVYGKGKWISSYDSQQIFLNHRLIEDSKLDLEKMQDKAAQFLIQFSGVAKVVTAHSLINVNYTRGVLSKIQASFNQKRSGDILYSLEPGWRHKLKDERDLSAEYSYNTQVPLLWYGWRIKRGSITRKIDIVDIVPTISSFINMSMPGGCEGEIIEELLP